MFIHSFVSGCLIGFQYGDLVNMGVQVAVPASASSLLRCKRRTVSSFPTNSLVNYFRHKSTSMAMPTLAWDSITSRDHIWISYKSLFVSSLVLPPEAFCPLSILSMETFQGNSVINLKQCFPGLAAPVTAAPWKSEKRGILLFQATLTSPSPISQGSLAKSSHLGKWLPRA